MPCQLAAAAFLFSFSTHPAKRLPLLPSDAGLMLIESSCNLFDSIRFEDIVLLHIIEA